MIKLLQGMPRKANISNNPFQRFTECEKTSNAIEYIYVDSYCFYLIVSIVSCTTSLLCSMTRKLEEKSKNYMPLHVNFFLLMWRILMPLVSISLFIAISFYLKERIKILI